MCVASNRLNQSFTTFNKNTMCGCTNKINGMKRKRIGAMSASGIQGAVTQALPIAGGYLVGEILTKQLTFLQNNPLMGNIVKLAAGAFLASSGKGLVSGMGIGLAANGAVGAVLPSLQKGGIARLLPPGVPSAIVAGVDAYGTDGQIKMQ
jgi:hypothetical protein